MDYVAKACQQQVGGGFDRGIKYFLENDFNELYFYTEQNCWQERQSHRVHRHIEYWRSFLFTYMFVCNTNKLQALNHSEPVQI